MKLKMLLTYKKKYNMAEYNSKKFKSLYDTFKSLFDNEGDVYETTKKSVEEDYQHGMIPTDIEKKIVLKILKDAAIDFYKSDVKILKEDEYLKTMKEYD